MDEYFVSKQFYPTDATKMNHDFSKKEFEIVSHFLPHCNTVALIIGTTISPATVRNDKPVQDHINALLDNGALLQEFTVLYR